MKENGGKRQNEGKIITSQSSIHESCTEVTNERENVFTFVYIKDFVCIFDPWTLIKKKEKKKEPIGINTI